MFTIEIAVAASEFQKHCSTIQQAVTSLELELIQGLYSCCLMGFQERWKTPQWTAKVKRVLHTLGQSKGYLVLPCLTDTGFQWQWMFDLVWVVAKADCQGKLDWKMTERLALACESEWNFNKQEILWDFYKLTFTVADLRLFVYNNDVANAADLCKKACPAFTGFRYLLLGFPCSESGRFRIDAWTA